MPLIPTIFESVTSGTQSHLSPVHQIPLNLKMNRKSRQNSE